MLYMASSGTIECPGCGNLVSECIKPFECDVCDVCDRGRECPAPFTCYLPNSAVCLFEDPTRTAAQTLNCECVECKGGK